LDHDPLLGLDEVPCATLRPDPALNGEHPSSSVLHQKGCLLVLQSPGHHTVRIRLISAAFNSSRPVCHRWYDRFRGKLQMAPSTSRGSSPQDRDGHGSGSIPCASSGQGKHLRSTHETAMRALRRPSADERSERARMPRPCRDQRRRRAHACTEFEKQIGDGSRSCCAASRDGASPT
jgi:hypothetical protein